MSSAGDFVVGDCDLRDAVDALLGWYGAYLRGEPVKMRSVPFEPVDSAWNQVAALASPIGVNRGQAKDEGAARVEVAILRGQILGIVEDEQRQAALSDINPSFILVLCLPLVDGLFAVLCWDRVIITDDIVGISWRIGEMIYLRPWGVLWDRTPEELAALEGRPEVL